MWAKCYVTNEKCDCGGEDCPRDEMYGADLFDDQKDQEVEVLSALGIHDD